MSDPTDLPQWAQWIHDNWASWEQDTVGPALTFSTIGALTFFLALYGHNKYIVIGGTALGAFTGYAVASAISDGVNDPTATGMFAIYANALTNNPMNSLLWVSGVTFVTFALTQVFGGEILDSVLAISGPYLELDALGVQLLVGVVIGLITVPAGVAMLSSTEWLAKMNPIYWLLKWGESNE